MATGLGIVVGSVNSVAAVDTGSSARFGESPRVVVTLESRLALSADAAPVLGPGAAAPAVVVGGFLERVGDPVGILADDGSIYRGEDLTATAIGCLVDEASRYASAEPTVVATYPVSWPHYTVDALREALDRAGFGEVAPVPEPTAALRWLEATHGPLGDGAVVVYDLGGTKLDITVARTGESTGIIGTPIHSDDISGAHFDHLTMQHILANVVDITALDVFDPAVEDALAALRVRAAAAKEALSADTETVVGVDLAGVYIDVRLVRDELEDLLREPLAASTGLIREAVGVAGLELGDVTHVLLIGGGAAIPLVAELISTNLGLPVVSSANPGHTAALGAATLATELGAAAAALAEPIAAAAVPNSVAAVVNAPRPAPVAPVVDVATETGMSRWKKVAIVGSAVAALTLVTSGVLAVGTGTFTGTVTESPASSTSAVVTTAPAAGAPVESSAPNATVTSAPGEPATSNAAATSRAESAPANNGDIGGATNRAPETPGPAAPAEQQQPQPQQQQQPQQPAQTQAPAPVQTTQNPAPPPRTEHTSTMQPQPNLYTVPSLPTVPNGLPLNLGQ